MSAASRHLPRKMFVNDGPETYRPRTAAARAAAAQSRPAARKATGLRGLTSILRRRLPLFFTTAAAILALGIALAAVQVPLYQASSEIVPPGAGTDASDAAAQVIRSQAMARDVARALGLDRDAAFIQSSGDTLIANVRDLAGINRVAPVPPGSAAALARAADRVGAAVSVSRPADTVSLMIGYTARSPQLAARAANQYAQQYARRQLADPAAQGGGVRILAEAEPPLSPITPSPIIIVLAAAAIGLLLGVLVAVLRERGYRGITSGGEIEARTGLHHLGTVPLVATMLKEARSPVDAIVASPRSGFAEAFRSLRTSIRIAGGQNAQVVAITSAQAGEGRSTVAACLARTIALSGDSVLLIDGGEDGAGASAILGIEPAPSLAEVAAGETTLDTALVHDAESGAYVLRLGTAADEGASRRLEPFMGELRQRFSHILIDAPAALRSDMAALTDLPADLFILAAKWRTTPDRAVRKAATALQDGNASVGGVVLTQVDMNRQVKWVHDDESNYYAKLSKYYS